MTNIRLLQAKFTRFTQEPPGQQIKTTFATYEVYTILTETCPRPLSEDCKRRVSLESRYGTWDAFPSLSFPITFTL